MNKKEFISKYNGRVFTRKINQRTSDEIRAILIDDLIKHGKDPTKMEEFADRFVYEGRVVKKDTRKQVQDGTITFKNKEYIFLYDGENRYGEIPPAAHFSEKEFYIYDVYNQKITYTVKGV